MVDERRVVAALPGLARLGRLRERRALAALAEAERALAVARRARDERLARLEVIERELAELAVDGPTPTVESFRLAADRRGWLHQDRKKERQRVDEREEELRAVESAVAGARRDWLRARERGVAVARRGTALRRDAERRAERRADLDREAAPVDGIGSACR